MSIEMELRVNLFAEAMETLVTKYFPEEGSVAFVCGISASGMDEGEHALLSSLNKAQTVYALRTMLETAERQYIDEAVAKTRLYAIVSTLMRFANDESAWPAGSLEAEIARKTRAMLAFAGTEDYDELAAMTELQTLVDQLNVAYAEASVVEDEEPNPKFN